MGSKALNPKAQPFFLNRFQTPYLPAWPVCAYRIVHQPRSFFCQLNLVQPNPTTKRVPRKSVKSKRNFAPPRSRNPLKKLEDENHVVGAPRVLAWVPKKDLPAGKRYTASYRQIKKDTVRGCDDGGGSGGGCVIPFPASPAGESYMQEVCQNAKEKPREPLTLLSRTAKSKGRNPHDVPGCARPRDRYHWRNSKKTGQL